MAVCIRLARHGSKKVPYYRIVVTDRRSPRDGRFIENLGTYDPRRDLGGLRVRRDRLEHWRKLGARPSQTVLRLLKKGTGARSGPDAEA